MRECFFGSHSVPATHENVLGVLSLIIYSLLLVISIKYIAIVMRADNQGEGGILALTALLPQRRVNARGCWLLILLGIFGAALLYGDGMITPAITVLGAVEGLKVATPLFDAVRRACRRRDSDRRVRDSAARHASRRTTVRSDHGGVVRRDRGARCRVAGASTGRAHRRRPAPRLLVLPRAWVARVCRARRRLSGGHRR